jgi:hypothetical protein
METGGIKRNDFWDLRLFVLIESRENNQRTFRISFMDGPAVVAE